jgi:hypothetical protein
VRAGRLAGERALKICLCCFKATSSLTTIPPSHHHIFIFAIHALS